MKIPQKLKTPYIFHCLGCGRELTRTTDCPTMSCFCGTKNIFADCPTMETIGDADHTNNKAQKIMGVKMA